MKELESSGRDDRALGVAARRLERGWASKLAQHGVAGEWSSFRCYAKGCYATAVHATEDEAEEATRVITRTGEFNGWQAGKMRSGVIRRDDGKTEVTWVLYTPPEEQNALADPLPPDQLDELTASVPNAGAPVPAAAHDG